MVASSAVRNWCRQERSEGQFGRQEEDVSTRTHLYEGVALVVVTLNVDDRLETVFVSRDAELEHLLVEELLEVLWRTVVRDVANVQTSSLSGDVGAGSSHSSHGSAGA